MPYLVGGHPALDLINSVERGIPVPGRPQVDWLEGWVPALTWAVHAHVLTEGEARRARAGKGSLQTLVALREAAHEACRASIGRRGWGEPEVLAALEVLDVHRRAAAGRGRLRPRPDGHGVIAVHTTDPDHMLPDRLVNDILDLLTGPDVDRLKACPVEAGGCGWLFVDRSRNGSRRWCRMEDCGTRTKSARLTERRRSGRRAAGQGEAAL
jgi:predicted RNA-binding Zn ribbon-like protein